MFVRIIHRVMFPKNYTVSALDTRCLNFDEFPDVGFSPKLGDFESIFLIYYSSCHSLLTRVNQSHLDCKMIPLHKNLRRQEKMNWGRKEKLEFERKGEE